MRVLSGHSGGKNMDKNCHQNQRQKLKLRLYESEGGQTDPCASVAGPCVMNSRKVEQSGRQRTETLTLRIRRGKFHSYDLSRFLPGLSYFALDDTAFGARIFAADRASWKTETAKNVHIKGLLHAMCWGLFGACWGLFSYRFTRVGDFSGSCWGLFRVVLGTFAGHPKKTKTYTGGALSRRSLLFFC